jgi:bifunctional non-homologous end joining protein LigD
MGLREYQGKRKFGNTPEPAQGDLAQGGASGRARIFVVQLHHASHRHFDFRLELDGVLKSWAIPKGPSFDPAVKRLAVEVEDHPLSYAMFEGDIPKGNYGAGHVDLFDQGTWESIGSARKGLSKGDLKFVLHGDVLRGSWVLVRTHRQQGTKNQWLLIKHQDDFAGEREANDFIDPKTDRPIALAKRRKIWPKQPIVRASTVRRSSKRIAPMPEGSIPEALKSAAFAPELCKAQEVPPAGDDWLHEVKWDGYRIVTTVVDGKVRMWSRNAIEWTAKVPELVKAVAALRLKNAQLDGEMIVLRDGRDDFNALQAHLSTAAVDAPLAYMLFDMPHLNGQSLRDVPLIERKGLLGELIRAKPHALLRYSEHQIGDGKTAFAQALAAGLEGVVSKRVDSGYRGTRNGDWIKAKGRPSDEFIVIGFTEPKKSRAGVGALLLAQPRSGKLVYVGRVGTGLSDEQLRGLRKQLSADIIETPAADIALMARSDQKLAIWVKPRLVVEVFFQGVGGQGLLRQPAFKGMRLDKTPEDLIVTATTKKKSSRPSKPPPMKEVAPAVRKPRRTSRKENAAVASDVVITHPEREVFPGTGITKAEVAGYYRAVSSLLLAELAGRPLSIVRCPDGIGKQCFFQKHAGKGWGEHIHGVSIRESKGVRKYVCIQDEAGLLELVQMNVLELHAWGAKSSDPEHADRLVFDLDPHASVTWARVRAAAREVRAQLDSIRLKSFLRTSGGKGLHLVVPLNPPAPWEHARHFGQAVAQALAALMPKEFVSIAGEKNRKGKIFVDWLRNGRGATSVASYSLRARENAGVAMPIAWEALSRVRGGDFFTIKNAIGHIGKREEDPWASIARIKQSLPPAWSGS